ncbi:hypothetical protein, partial [Wolbachia endosymbiont of Pentidionis agamae]|uniref:hypothetical protein n=1 Tax=Wolbachia endosymbiont of Pentidionis agamae TaxID=3110435 RepID=UPI002FD5FC18
MNLYEFAFIAQQSLSNNEVEGIVQDFAVFFVNIRKQHISKALQDIINEVIKLLSEFIVDAEQELIKNKLKEDFFKKKEEEYIIYANVLENLLKALSNLELDFSNFQSIKLHIQKDVFEEIKEASTSKILSQYIKKIDEPKQVGQIAFKVSFIENVMREFVKLLKKSILESVLKSTNAILTECKVRYDKEKLVII